ncbi:MAG TPA: PilZ domain-containing protein [Nitrospiraceae bacterium]|nr:PilZ domain-containing protein [Nitrospiraceae bacterium]
MKQLKVARQTTVHHPHGSMERREIPRAPVSFGLMYSGLIGNDVLMGDGIVVDLSKGGLGIRGNQAVKVGMELTLFLYLPDGEDPLFVLEAGVAWTGGHLFGVEFKKLSLREGNRLHAFLRTQTAEYV